LTSSSGTWLGVRRIAQRDDAEEIQLRVNAPRVPKFQNKGTDDALVFGNQSEASLSHYFEHRLELAMTHRSTSQQQDAAMPKRDGLSRYERALLDDAASSPPTDVSTEEKRLDPDNIHDRHNRIRMWSYKAAGIDPK
jgi:hypothetical protein